MTSRNFGQFLTPPPYIVMLLTIKAFVLSPQNHSWFSKAVTLLIYDSNAILLDFTFLNIDF